MDVSGSIYLLDTNIIAYIVDSRSQNARHKFEEALQHSSVAISAISAGELLFGLENKPSATQRREAVEELFKALFILPWDFAAARAYGKLRAQLSRAGKTLAELDLQIAAHAIAADAVLVTHDKAFNNASAFLDVIDWATDLSPWRRG